MRSIVLNSSDFCFGINRFTVARSTAVRPLINHEISVPPVGPNAAIGRPTELMNFLLGRINGTHRLLSNYV